MKYLGKLLLVIGLGMLYFSFTIWRAHADFSAHAISADGVVIDLPNRSSTKGSNSLPIVQFATADGNIVHVTITGGSSPATYSRGEHVRLLYDPANPETARLDTFMETRPAPRLLGGIGILIALIGVGAIYYQRRQRRLCGQSTTG